MLLHPTSCPSFLAGCPWSAGGRKRKAGKLHKALPWEQEESADDAGDAFLAAAAAAVEPAAQAEEDAGLAAEPAAPAANGDVHAGPAAEQVGAAAAAGAPTLADYATALAGHLGPGAAFETPGSTPAKLALNGMDDLNGLLEEGEDSTADILSPGGGRAQHSLHHFFRDRLCMLAVCRWHAARLCRAVARSKDCRPVLDPWHLALCVAHCASPVPCRRSGQPVGHSPRCSCPQCRHLLRRRQRR